MRKTQYLLVFLLILSLHSFGQETEILVDANWLSDKLEKDEVVVLHIGMEKDFDKEHIPGALLVGPGDYTYDDQENNIIFDRPEDDVLKGFLESKGISNETTVVIYTPSNWIPLVTRLYFTLDYLGHGDKTYILDGGLVAWKESGKGVSSEVTQPTSKGSFKVRPNSALLADTDYVFESIENESNTIVDCRSEVYYTSIKPTRGARLGKIPTAKNIPYTSLYEASSIGAYKFKRLDDLKAIFKAQGLDENQPLVLYCHIGMQLTVVYTAAKILGYTDIKMYDPSFNVWGKDESLPVVQD